MKKNATIITIEGTDCSGKETQSKLLLESLLNEGYKVKLYSFPQYELPTGRIVGECYLGKGVPSFFEECAPNVDPLISSVFYAANRREAFLKYIEKELSKNDFIILDRYVTSNLGHQGSKGKTKKERQQIYNFINYLEYELMELPRPDITLFLHMPYEAACVLKKNRTELDDNEKSEKHLREAEENYLHICETYKWKYINCLNKDVFKDVSDIKTPEEIHKELLKNIKKIEAKEKIKMTRF